MKKFTLLVMFSFIFIGMKAQQNTDVLMLKNGSIIRGSIIENNNIMVKILSAGNLLVFSKDEIDKMDFETKLKTENNLVRKGYYNITTMGVLIGSKANDKRAPVSVLMEHNFRLSDYISMGGVFGFEMLNETVCPIALNFRTIIPSIGGEYMLGITGGYLISTEDIQYNYYGEEIDSKGGKLFNVELGYLSSISKFAGVYFGIGYRYSELNYSMDSWMYNTVDRKIFFHRISFRMGISLF